MNLTPEEKAIGRENFYAAVGSNLKIHGESQSPRDFLKQAVVRGVTCGGRPNASIPEPLDPASTPSLGEYYFEHDFPPAERLRVGVIGTGDEGSVLIGAINPNYIDVRAVADIRPYNIHRAFYGDYSSATARSVRCGLMAKYGWKTKEEGGVKEYGHYEELIANAQADGIEAVIIALPLHLHAPAAIKAMRAGLHVLTEKLMGHSVRECKEMALVARETGMILATGHQRHYNILYDRAVDLIERGVLGDLHYIRAQWHRGNLPHSDSWQQPMPRAVKPDDPKSMDLIRKLEEWSPKLQRAQRTVEALKKKKPARGIANWEREIKKWESELKKYQREIDKYQPLVDQVNAQIRDAEVDAVKYGYKDAVIRDAAGNVVYRRPAMEELIRWRLWDRTGGGLMAELGSHQLDAASIFIAAVHGGKKQYPLSVAAAANRPIFPPDREVDDHVFCVFEFPAPGYYEDDGKTVKDPQKKIGVQYASINGNGFGGYGETVFGTKGTLILEREKEALLFQTQNTPEKGYSELKIKVGPLRDKSGKVVRDKDGNVAGAQMDISDSGDRESAAIGELAMKEAQRGYTEEMEHWAWCIKNPAPENQPRCKPEVALGDAVIALATNMAAREGRRIEFKKEWFQVDSPLTPEGLTPDPNDPQRYG